MISLMMCDDYVSLCDMVLGAFEKKHDFTICGKAASGEACINLIEQGTIPDLLILDICLPKMPGYEVAKYLRQNYPQIKILVFSMITDINAVKAMIRFGVDGFVFKDTHIETIEKIIKLIMNGETYYPPEFIFNEEEIKAIKSNPVPWAEQITQRELTAVQLLAKDLSRKQVADAMGISPSVVNKKMANLFKKTGHRTTLAVIDFLRKVGLLS